MVQGKIILIGGRGEDPNDSDDFMEFDSVIEWDPITDKWRHLNKLKCPRAEPKLCVTGGKIFVVGGRGWQDEEDGEEEARNTGEFLDLKESNPEWKWWSCIKSSSFEPVSIVNTNTDGHIYVYGERWDDHYNLMEGSFHHYDLMKG